MFRLQVCSTRTLTFFNSDAGLKIIIVSKQNIIGDDVVYQENIVDWFWPGVSLFFIYSVCLGIFPIYLSLFVVPEIPLKIVFVSIGGFMLFLGANLGLIPAIKHGHIKTESLHRKGEDKKIVKLWQELLKRKRDLVELEVCGSCPNCGRLYHIFSRWMIYVIKNNKTYAQCLNCKSFYELIWSMPHEALCYQRVKIKKEEFIKWLKK